MTGIKYGLISSVDSRCLEKTIDLICNEFHDKFIHVTEIGLYNGKTTKGICDYIWSKDKGTHYIGVDNNKDGEVNLFPHLYQKQIIGNSNEVYNQIPDDSQHLCFIDSCHCFSCVISDFFCYIPKVKTGGYIAFHDTATHIEPFKDFQHGDKDNPDAYISVRKALGTIGLFNVNYYGHGMLEEWVGNFGVQLIFDEADENDPAGGVCVFRKL